MKLGSFVVTVIIPGIILSARPDADVVMRLDRVLIVCGWILNIKTVVPIGDNTESFDVDAV